MDMHANSSQLGLFIVGNSYDSVYRFERHIVLPKIIAQNCPDFSHENTIYNCDQVKEGSSRRFFCTSLNPDVNTYTLEVSLLGYMDDEEEAIVEYTEDSYIKAGRNIARAFWDYYKIMGCIPLDPSDVSPDGTAATGGSFNLLRLKEIAEQRSKSAKDLADKSDEDENGGGGGGESQQDGDGSAKGKRKRCNKSGRGRRSPLVRPGGKRPSSQSTVTTITWTDRYYPSSAAEDSDDSSTGEGRGGTALVGGLAAATGGKIRLGDEEIVMRYRLPPFHSDCGVDFGRREEEGVLSVEPHSTYHAGKNTTDEELSRREVKVTVVTPDLMLPRAPVPFVASNWAGTAATMPIKVTSFPGGGSNSDWTPSPSRSGFYLYQIGGGAHLSNSPQKRSACGKGLARTPVRTRSARTARRKQDCGELAPTANSISIARKQVAAVEGKPK